MKEDEPGPTAPKPPEQDDLYRTRLEEGETIFGERLLPLVSGPLPGSDMGRSSIALKRTGETLLLVSVPALSASAAARIVDQLDRLGEMDEATLSKVAGASVEELRARHARHFSMEQPPQALNEDQSAVIVVRREPTREGWRAVIAELGDRLQGLYVATATGPERRDPPAVAAVADEKRSGLLTSLAVGGLALGLILAIIGLARVLRSPAEETPAAPVVLGSSLTNVVFDTPADATRSSPAHQQRLVRVSDGRLLFIYPDDGRVTMVTDQADQGRNWRSAMTVDGLEAEAVAAAIDQDDHLHLAARGPEGLTYAVLVERRGSWEVIAQEVVEPAPGGSFDIAWDASDDVAHVIWAKTLGAREQPYWAGLSESEGQITNEGEEAFAEMGAVASVLVQVASDGKGRTVVGYRRGDTGEGWFVRRRTQDEPDWSEEQRIPDTATPMGAASLELDPRGIAHLLVRDDVNFDIRYYRGTQRGWSSGKTIIGGDTLSHVEHPVLSVDRDSRLLFAFHQTDAFLDGISEIRFSLFDPAIGWEGPYAVAPEDQIPGGAVYPTAMGVTAGVPAVLWTGVTGPQVMAARIPIP